MSEIQKNVPFSAYLQIPRYSQSVLKYGQLSMAHLKAARDKERVLVPTDAMILGSCLHTCFLEPDKAAERIAVWPEANGSRRGKDWQAFKEENADRYIITANAEEQLCGMLDSLRKHPVVKQWMSRIEGVEVGAIGEIDGLPMKGRCDALSDDPMFDLKKTTSCDYATVQRTVIKYGYDIQAAVYRRLFNRSRFVLLFVEDEPPYDVVAYELNSQMLKRADIQLRALIAQVKECEKSGVWPGRCDEIVELELPGWIQDQEQSYIEFGVEKESGYAKSSDVG